MPRHLFQQVDVFTSVPYLGNPVAVVFGADDLEDGDMQRFARWTNLSETTFLLAPTDPLADYRLRIFTPGGELPFAGHPTLGSCHAWRQAGGRPKAGDRIVQQCGVGLVELQATSTGQRFAAPPLRRAPIDPDLQAAILRAVGLQPTDVMASQVLDNGPLWHALLLRESSLVDGLRPDHAALKALGTKVGVAAISNADPEADDDAGGLLIARSNREARAFGPSSSPAPQLLVRGFAAPIGVDEDPVTGSLNASLGQWLIGEGLLPSRYEARQGQALGRDGFIDVSQDAGGQVWVGGDAVTCIEGHVTI